MHTLRLFRLDALTIAEFLSHSLATPRVSFWYALRTLYPNNDNAKHSWSGLERQITSGREPTCRQGAVLRRLTARVEPDWRQSGGGQRGVAVAAGLPPFWPQDIAS